MNTLTPNRILQKGDEYRDNGTWKPVPKDDFGLQVMFTKYAEVRRPTETKHESRSAESVTVKPETRTPKAVPAPKKPSEAGTTLPNPSPIETVVECFPDKATQLAQAAEAYLPTVISTKAHRHGETPFPSDAEAIKTATKAIRAVLAKPIVLAGTTETQANITWHSKLEPECQWIGRNGTFRCRGMNIYKHGKGIIKLVPVGARGVAKNAEIEFPVNAIPQVIDFLTKMHNQHKTPK